MSDLGVPAELVNDAVGAVEGVVSQLADSVLQGLHAQELADRLWNDVLRRNRGGHHRAGAFTTDFEAVPTVDALRAMIETTDPAAVQAVSDHWKNLHDELEETAAQLDAHVANLLDRWTGPSADAFRRQAETLHTSLTNGAAHAANAATATGGVARALAQARADMPPDPTLLDTVLRAVTSQGADWQFKSDAAHHGLSHALAVDGAQLSAPEQARQQAVVVMERLGIAYNNATAQLDHPPAPASAAHRHGVWPPRPDEGGTAHASLLGHGPMSLGATAGVAVGGAGLPAAGPGGSAGPAAWVGAPPPEVSPTARAASTTSGRGPAAEAEPEPGTTGQPAEGLRPTGSPTSSGSHSRRNRTRYPLGSDPDTWDENQPANPPVIDA